MYLTICNLWWSFSCQSGDPKNVKLNYAYGVLSARIQIRLVADGYGQTMSVMHDDKETRGKFPAFADREILHRLILVVFQGANFSIQYDGVCRLNPVLARRVAELVVDSIESFNGDFPGP
jgi:hypothetical protein